MSGQEPSGQSHGLAAFEEQAELLRLRDHAGRTAAEAAQTLTELADRLDLARQPGFLARRLATDARHTAVRTLRATLGRVASQTGARRAVLAAIPALAVAAMVAVIVSRQRARLRHPAHRPGEAKVSTGKPALDMSSHDICDRGPG